MSLRGTAVPFSANHSLGSLILFALVHILLVYLGHGLTLSNNEALSPPLTDSILRGQENTKNKSENLMIEMKMWKITD